MKLELTYNKEKREKTRAVFLSSSKVSDWLDTLSQWEVAYQVLECYAVPTSISSPSPAGLFVIFPNHQVPELSIGTSPYQCIVNRLYIPVDATITPQVLADEWDDLLLYDRNFYHPRIGLVGFNIKDQVNFKQLISLPELDLINWDVARPGPNPRPPLTSIKLSAPPISSLMESLRSEMDTRPLEDIPDDGKDEESGLRKDLNEFQRFLLKKLLQNDPSKNKQNRNQDGNRSRRNMSRYDNPGGSGIGGPLSNLFGRAGAWLNQRLEDLEEHRENEIKRLLRMLDEDPDQALRYSIPLDGPYKNRGTAPPSSRLGQRDTDFNLDNIKGGGKADFWNLDKHYFSLREKYQKMARRQLEAGDYRKAAYIYAHLLGDFHAAASALKQGKYYREAATVYKEHLKNLSQAALCLEEGGLILEAIDVYKELAKNEKVGDLYADLEQFEKAKPFYEKAMAEQLNSDNYLAACRICQEKLQEPDRTRKLLLEGWKTSKQGEQCLLQYFEHIQWQPEGGEKDQEEVEQQLDWVYQHHVPDHKRRDFVSILVTLNRKHQQFPNVGRDIAYEIISEQTLGGHPDLLPKLHHFIDHDPLLKEDTSRFLYQNEDPVSPLNSPTNTFYLDSKVRWKTALALPHSLIVAGLKARELIIARANWEGKVQYAATRIKLQDSNELYFVEPNLSDSDFTLLSDEPISANRVTFDGGSYDAHFRKAISISFPDWLPKGAVRVSQIKHRSNSALVVLDHNHQVQCIHYTREGQVAATYDCMIKDQPLTWEGGRVIKPMFFRDNYFYTHMKRKVLRIAMDGKTEVVSSSEQLLSIAMSPSSTAKRLVLKRPTYLSCFQPSFQKLDAERNMLRTKISRPKHISFLGSSNLLIAGDTSGEIYDLKYQRIIHRFPSKPSVIAVTTAAGRREFALVHQNGMIEVKEAPPV
ncbi:MAG: hypothetical protein F6K19_11560 [Cyanothece sp. SIO1E1]|nr:hypothetical protein [Cyanothece sp. SIO1E1]